MCDSLVTIVVRTINRSQLLARAVNSTKLQTYSRIEVLIVNDGGASLVDWVKDYSEVNIKLIELSENKGRSAAANVGIREASGDYLVFLDDDGFFISQSY